MSFDFIQIYYFIIIILIIILVTSFHYYWCIHVCVLNMWMVNIYIYIRKIDSMVVWVIDSNLWSYTHAQLYKTLGTHTRLTNNVVSRFILVIDLVHLHIHLTISRNKRRKIGWPQPFVWRHKYWKKIILVPSPNYAYIIFYQPITRFTTLL